MNRTIIAIILVALALVLYGCTAAGNNGAAAPPGIAPADNGASGDLGNFGDAVISPTNGTGNSAADLNATDADPTGGLMGAENVSDAPD